MYCSFTGFGGEGKETKQMEEYEKQSFLQVESLDCKTLHLQHHCQGISEVASDLKYKLKFDR